jgi:hypothetical protein
MGQPHDDSGFEHGIGELKASIDKYLSDTSHADSDVAADLTKAVHDLSDHVVDLHRRVEKIENDQEEWTTHGWLPPSGSEIPP